MQPNNSNAFNGYNPADLVAIAQAIQILELSRSADPAANFRGLPMAQLSALASPSTANIDFGAVPQSTAGNAPQSTAPTTRSQSTAPPKNAPQSTAPTARPQSTAPTTRPQSTAPTTRSQSTAPPKNAHQSTTPGNKAPPSNVFQNTGGFGPKPAGKSTEPRPSTSNTSTQGGNESTGRRQTLAHESNTCSKFAYVSASTIDENMQPLLPTAGKEGAQQYDNPEISDTVRKIVISKGKADIYYFNQMYCEKVDEDKLKSVISSQRANRQFTLECDVFAFDAKATGSREDWRGFFKNTEHLRILGKYTKATFKHLLFSGENLTAVDAMHCDFGKQSTMNDVLRVLPTTFDTVIMETKTLDPFVYEPCTAALCKWLEEEEPSFHEMTIFVESLPLPSGVAKFLKTFPHTAFKGTVFVICTIPATNIIVTTMDLQYLGAASFNRLPQEHQFNLFVKKEEGCKNLILGFKFENKLE